MIADYRLYPQVRYPAFLQDGAQAVAWAVNHSAEYGADPKQLYVMGHSSGAYNAAMLALDGRWLKAVGLAPSIFTTSKSPSRRSPGDPRRSTCYTKSKDKSIRRSRK